MLIINKMVNTIQVKGGTNKMNKRAQSELGLAIWGAVAIIVMLTLFLSFYIVPAGKRGIEFTFGKPSMDAQGEGLHFKFPYVQTVKKMEVRTTKIEAEAASVSSDLQDVNTLLVLNYHLTPWEVPKLWQEIGPDYEERIIAPAIQESLKAVMAKFAAEELTGKRAEVSQEIEVFLAERLVKYHITVDDFSIVNFKFGDEFAEAIEQKAVARQDKLRAEIELETIKIEKKQRIAQAEGEAEALRLQKAHITPDLLEQKRLEVELKALEVEELAIDKWDGIMPKVVGGAMPFINMNLEEPKEE